MLGTNSPTQNIPPNAGPAGANPAMPVLDPTPPVTAGAEAEDYLLLGMLAGRRVATVGTGTGTSATRRPEADPMATATTTRTDEEIQREVLAELKWDARVLPNEIGVAVKDGVVTLTGWVDSFTK